MTAYHTLPDSSPADLGNIRLYGEKLGSPKSATATPVSHILSLIAAVGLGIERYATEDLRDAVTTKPAGTLCYVFANNGATDDPANGWSQATGTTPPWEDAPWMSNDLIAAVQPLVDLAEAWAEGTLPGGTGTKSAKEWAELAQTDGAVQVALAAAQVALAAAQVTAAADEADRAEAAAAAYVQYETIFGETCIYRTSDGYVLDVIGDPLAMPVQDMAAEIVESRGSAASLPARLSRHLSAEGTPKQAFYNIESLRWSHGKLNRLRCGAADVRFHLCFIGDSWTYTERRFSRPVGEDLLYMRRRADVGGAVADAGPGWVGLGHGIGNWRPDVYKVGPAAPAYPNASQGPIDPGQTGTSAWWSGTGWAETGEDFGGAPVIGIAVERTSTPGDRKIISGPDAALFTTVKHYWQGTVNGVIRYSWNGGATWTTQNVQGTVGALNFASIATGKPASGAWQLIIECVSGTWVPNGCFFAGVAGILVSETALSGSTSSNWIGQKVGLYTDWTADEIAGWKAGYADIAPDCIVITLLTNDRSGDMVPATYAANIRLLIERLRAALPGVQTATMTTPPVDILVICPNQTTEVGKVYTQAQYMDALRPVADDLDVALINLQQIMGVPGTYDGWCEAPTDLRHPGPMMSANIQYAVTAALMGGLPA